VLIRLLRRDRAPRRRPAAARAAATGGPRPLVPTDPSHAWTAEIEWQEAGGDRLFRVIARSETHAPMVLAASEPLPWPPAGPEAIAAMSSAVDALAARMQAAGWRPLTAGGAWYAQRFAWEPDQEPRRRRFVRASAWPDGTERLWRSEITWEPGYARSQFRVVAYPPGDGAGATLATSRRFRWMLMAQPDAGAPELAAEVRRLAEALAAAGWEPVAPGSDWYAGRWVWHRAAPPPKTLDLPSPETTEVS
jgi:hypothetical protein